MRSSYSTGDTSKRDVGGFGPAVGGPFTGRPSTAGSDGPPWYMGSYVRQHLEGVTRMAARTGNGLTRRRLLQAAGGGAAGAALSKLGGPWTRRASAQGTRTMTVGLYADAISLDPFDSNDNLSLGIEREIYDGLVGFTPDMKVRPELATAWEAAKDAKT